MQPAPLFYVVAIHPSGRITRTQPMDRGIARAMVTRLNGLYPSITHRMEPWPDDVHPNSEAIKHTNRMCAIYAVWAIIWAVLCLATLWSLVGLLFSMAGVAWAKWEVRNLSRE